MFDAMKSKNRLLNKVLARTFLLSTIVITIAISLTILINTYVTTIFLNAYPASSLSYLYFSQAIILMLVTFSTRNIIANQPKKFCFFIEVLSTALIIFYLIIGHDWNYFTLIYCAILTTISAMNAIIAWNFVAWTFTMREFKENSRLFSAVGTLFGIGLGYLLPLAIHAYGVNVLVYFIIFLLLLFIIPVSNMPIMINAKTSLNKKQYASNINQHKIFIWLFLYVAVLLLSNTLIDFVVKGTVAKTNNSNDIASYMATLYATANIFVLSAQLFLMKPFLRWFGAGGILYSTPIAVIVSAIIYLIHPSLTTATILFVINLSIYYSLFNLAREISLNVLPPLVRAKAKSLIKGFANTVGAIAGSIIILMMSKLFGLYANVIFIIFTSVILIYLAYQIKLQYKKELSDQLLLKRFKSDDLLLQLEAADNYDEILSSTIRSHDIGLNLLGISILKKAKYKSALPKELKYWLEHDSEALFFAVAKLSCEINDPSLVKIIDKRMRVEKQSQIKLALLKIIKNIDEAKTLLYAKKLITNEDPALRAFCAYLLLQKGNFQEVKSAIDTIAQLMQSQHPVDRAEAAKIIGDLPVGNLSNELVKLVNDKSDIVCINALYAASKIKSEKIISAVAAQFNRNAVIYHVLKLADKFGDPLLVPLIEQMNKHSSLKNIVNAAKIINQIKTPQSEVFIIDLLENLDFFERYQLAKYFAYRCKSQAIDLKSRDKIFNIIKQLAEYIITLHFAKSTAEPFLEKELSMRIFWAKKSFLYLLSVISNTEKILPILPNLTQAISQNNTHNINTALELIEAYLTTSEQKKILGEIFDDLNEASSTATLSQVIAHDLWLMTMVNYVQSRKRGEVMESLEKVIILRQCELFKELPGETLLAIAEEADILNFEKDDVIYAQGDIADGLYIIAQGEVALVRDKNTLIDYKQYDFFGFMGIIQNKPYYASAKALTACQLLCLDKVTFDRILEDVPDVLMSITRVMASYLAKIMVKERLIFP